MIKMIRVYELEQVEGTVLPVTYNQKGKEKIAYYKVICPTTDSEKLGDLEKFLQNQLEGMDKVPRKINISFE